MNALQAEDFFLEYLEEQNLDLDNLSLKEGLNAMLTFYAEETAEDISFEDDGDMFTVRWGYTDWEEEDSETFNLSIVRKFRIPQAMSEEEMEDMEGEDYISEDEDGEQTWELSLSFTYVQDSLEEDEADVPDWIYTPDEAPEYKEALLSTDIIQNLLKEEPRDIQLKFEQIEADY
jgi:hypothetical protein